MKIVVKNNKGFTLMELMVVMAIIGILGVVLIPNLMKNIENANIKADKANAAVIATAAMTACTMEEEDVHVEGTEEIDKTKIQNYLNGGEIPTPLGKDDDTFYVEIDTEGNISVYYDSDKESKTNKLFP